MTNTKFNNIIDDEKFWLYKLKRDYCYQEDKISYKKIYKDLFYKTNHVVYWCKLDIRYKHFGEIKNSHISLNLGFPGKNYIDECIESINNTDIYKNELMNIIKKKANVQKMPEEFAILHVKAINYSKENPDFYFPFDKYYSFVNELNKRNCFTS